MFDMVLGGLDQFCVDQLVVMSINWFNFFTILMIYLDINHDFAQTIPALLSTSQYI